MNLKKHCAKSQVLMVCLYSQTQELKVNTVGLWLFELITIVEVVIETYLIPSSAHGTNPASAVKRNEVVVTKCDEEGNIDLNDLQKRPKNTALI